MSIDAISDTLDSCYSSPKEEPNATDLKTSLFVLSLLALCAGGLYIASRKKKPLNQQGPIDLSPTPQDMLYQDRPVTPPPSPTPRQDDSPSPTVLPPPVILTQTLARSTAPIVEESKQSEEDSSSSSSSAIFAPPVISTPAPKPITRELPACTDTEKSVIETVFGVVADRNVVYLFKEMNQLDSWKKEIGGVHPFTLLTHVKQEHMQKIFAAGGIKRSSTLSGVTSGIWREHQKKNLAPFFNTFAAQMKKDTPSIIRFFQNQNWNEGQQDWKPFLKYLFDIK